ncbi:tryptophan-rich sensory protein [Aminipila butyrica]|uniref:Tryptophan-rich sensory protein n=1 Tax=Aminipila butyrica TaxID=433296 RepID=A0A858BVM4_9FIRM|nr:tryptophan-rich sensory protein [Aminipila butyrica]
MLWNIIYIGGDYLKIKWKLLLICIAIPLMVGGIAGFISRNSMSAFEALNKPPLSPPGWVFPVAWTILYILMGIASYLILTSDAPQKRINKAMKLYVLQLFFNFLWTFWFFNLELYLFAFIWLVALWLLILITILSFSRISKPAAYLMVPYLLWVTFAGYLNLGIALLN